MKKGFSLTWLATPALLFAFLSVLRRYLIAFWKHHHQETFGSPVYTKQMKEQPLNVERKLRITDNIDNVLSRGRNISIWLYAIFCNSLESVTWMCCHYMISEDKKCFTCHAHYRPLCVLSSFTPPSPTSQSEGLVPECFDYKLRPLCLYEISRNNIKRWKKTIIA